MKKVLTLIVIVTSIMSCRNAEILNPPIKDYKKIPYISHKEAKRDSEKSLVENIDGLNFNSTEYQSEIKKVSKKLDELNFDKGTLKEIEKSDEVYKSSLDDKVLFVEASPENGTKKGLSTIKNVDISKLNAGNGNNQHGFNAVSAFISNNKEIYNATKEELENNEIPIIVQNYSKENDLLTHKGIINASFGIVDSNLNLGDITADKTYINKRINFKDDEKTRLNDFISQVYLDENYLDNRQLKIKSLGNYNLIDSRNEPWYSGSVHTFYQKSSPLVQEMMRTDIIHVKNVYSADDIMKKYNTRRRFFVKELSASKDLDGNIHKYYEAVYTSGRHYETKPMLLRAFTVGENGMMIVKDSDGVDQISEGSSYSAPKVARTAYDVKKKFPFLTYNQVKQTILTTARRDGDGYLSDFVGWGVVDKEKALRGPSDFNAGLILEERFFRGMPDRIMDKEGNLYFYANVDDAEYEFSNDIVTGLSGDGNNKDYHEIYFAGKYAKNQVGFKNFLMHLPKVIDSERNYYRNVKKAGLRKDGKGTLILSGRQYYDTKTQVLNGTLVLKNDSNSNYEVFKDANFKIETQKGLDDLIVIHNKLVSDGNIYLKTNLNVDSIKTSKESTLNIDAGKKIKVKDEANIGGKISLDAKDITDLENVITGNNIKLNAAIENIFLEKKEFKNNEYYTLSFDIPKDKLIKDLSLNEKRNILTYDVNADRFIKGFEMDPRNLVAIANVKTDDLDEAKKQLFTDNYVSLVSTILENNEKIKNMLTDDMFNNKNNIYIRNYINSNILKDKNYEPFKKKLNAFNFGAKYKWFTLYLSKYSSTNTYDKNKYSTKNYLLGVDFKKNFNNIGFNTNFNYTRVEANGSREVSKKINKSNITANIYNINANLSYEHKFSVANIVPFIGYNVDIFQVEKFKEEGEKAYTLKLNSKIMTKHSVNLGLRSEYYILPNLTLKQRLKLNVRLNPSNSLNFEIFNKNVEFKGKDLKNFELMYNAGLEYTINKNLAVEGMLDLNSNGDVGLKTTLKILY